MTNFLRNNNLAPTELVRSENREWIGKELVIDNMGNFFRSFHDGILEPPRMNSQIWFERRTKTPCPPCGLCYCPHQDRQRYCSTCSAWIHISCLDDSFGPQSLDYTISPDPVVDPANLNAPELLALCEKVLEGPSVRGHGGSYETYDWDNNWLNTGSGVQKGLIRAWKEEGAVPADWEKGLGENFLQDFLKKSWTTYTCPSCGLSGI